MITEEMFRSISTPAYLFSEEILLGGIRRLRDCLGEEIRIVYAMKANPFLVAPLLGAVDAFEVCSPGEERICRSLGVPPEMLVLSGVNKEEENFREIVGRCGALPVYTAESPRQAEMLSRLGEASGLRLRVLLRLTSGNQFGMDAAAAEDILRRAEDFPGIEIAGIQRYSGTQKKSRKIWKEIEELDEAMARFEAVRPLRELEYGPGLAVSYFEGEAADDPEALLSELRARLKGMRFQGQVTLELGRFIAAACGFYLTRLADLKHSEGFSYCIADGGIHQMSFYGQMMGMKRPKIRHIRAERPAHSDAIAAELPARESAGKARGDGETSGAEGPGSAPEADSWTVCGSLCTTADVMVRDLPLTNPGINDILVFERAGAYSVTEGISLFLSRDLPAVYAERGGELVLLRDRVNTEEWNYGRTDRNP